MTIAAAPPALSGAPLTVFDRTIALAATGDAGVFDVELSERWLSLVGVHGGYLAAIAAAGAEREVLDRRVRTVTTSFLHSGRPGPARVAVRELRHGRSITTLVADVVQGGRTITTTRLTLVADRRGIEWSAPNPIVLPPPEACIPLEPPNPLAHFDHAVALIDPSSLPFSGGTDAVVRGYLRPVETRPIDAAWLAMASDWFPPPAFVRVAPPIGGISIDLTTHVHRELPVLEDEWLAASFEVVTSAGGLATEHGRIATIDGTLLAESFQTRWTAEG